MSYTPRSLFRLLEEIDAHQLLLPHIQRPFVWEREQMERLFDSLMRDYPIQTFLFWRTEEEIRARRFMSTIDPDQDLSELYDFTKSVQGVEKIFVLDGQQRLQTLHCIFRGNVKDDKERVSEGYCDLTDGEAAIDGGDLFHRLVFSPERLELPQFRIRDLTERYGNRNPMSIADDINDALEQELSEVSEVRRKRERQVRANLLQLYSLLHHDKYFWVDELDGVAREYPYRRILEIFVRVNSGGTKLTAGDLMFAAMKEGWDDIEARVEQTVDLLNGGRLSIENDLILKCLLLAHGEGAEVQTEKFYGARGETLLKRIEDHWDRAESAFQQLRDLMIHELRLHSDKLVRSYNALVPLFDFLFCHPKPDEATRTQMAAYFHKAQLFGWFGSQTDTVLNAMHGVIARRTNPGFPLSEIKRYFKTSRRLPTEIQEANLNNTRLRPQILNIVYCDRWGSSPFDVAFKGNQPHIDHIYPQYMLRSRLECRTAEINDIGNLRFFGATDNIRKRGELPASYFGRLRAQGVPIEKHLLVSEFSQDPSSLKFDRPAYDVFRAKRRQEVWKSVKRIVDPEEFQS